MPEGDAAATCCKPPNGGILLNDPGSLKLEGCSRRQMCFLPMTGVSNCRRVCKGSVGESVRMH